MEIKDHATNHAINHSIVVVINNIKIMKNILLLTFLLYPALCLAQNVKVSSATDDFTGTKAITTSWVRIHNGGATGYLQTRARFRHAGNADFIEFRIHTEPSMMSCDAGNQVLFKTEHDVIPAENMGYAISTPGAWHPAEINNRLGLYLVCSLDASQLKGKQVSKIRFFVNGSYVDIKLTKNDQSRFNALYDAFMKVLG